ncbi:MAG: sigma-54 dependent transcriptional regulator [Myxococcota bacterium]
MRERILVIDDDGAFRFAMRKALSRLDYEVLEAEGGKEALSCLRRDVPPDIALLDLSMKDMNGLEVLKRRGACPTPIIVLTGHGTVDAAVEAMRLGAFSFLEKPVDAAILAPLLKRALAETARTASIGSESTTPDLVGTSPSMTELKAFIKRIAPTDETVTIYGETGTGKEVVARQIHWQSERRNKPFVALNAACVPRDLFESELFGHRKGAFTGASADHKGLFVEADKGTLFIDELAELPLDSQAKLLRALETRCVRPLGANKEVSVDVRIVAATNRLLWREVNEKRFREDLYFRLQVFPVVVPPLRERLSDLSDLCRHLLDRLGHPDIDLEPEAEPALTSYGWPGNVRELLNVLRRSALFADSGTVGHELIRRMVAASVFGRTGVPQQQKGRVGERSLSDRASEAIEAESLADVERAHIERTLQRFGGNITRTAAALKIDRRTLQRKLRDMGDLE